MLMGQFVAKSRHNLLILVLLILTSYSTELSSLITFYVFFNYCYQTTVFAYSVLYSCMVTDNENRTNKLGQSVGENLNISRKGGRSFRKWK